MEGYHRKRYQIHDYGKTQKYVHVHLNQVKTQSPQAERNATFETAEIVPVVRRPRKKSKTIVYGKKGEKAEDAYPTQTRQTRSANG